MTELDAAREAIDEFSDVSIRSIKRFEQALSRSAPDRLGRLSPYSPPHVLLSREIDELFDTSADLSGADIDVSRFIREGADRDVVVFWRTFPDSARPDPTVQPDRDELCAVPIQDAKPWVKKNSGEKRLIYCWDWPAPDRQRRGRGNALPSVLLHKERRMDRQSTAFAP